MNGSDPLSWVPAFETNRIPVGECKVFKKHGRQIAIFRLDEATFYAVDNHCPHEGYPLAQGYVKDCILTCAWHNFKFDLRDGRCLIGEEDVRTWPVRVLNGQLELDLTPPDLSAEVPRLYVSLEAGLSDRAMGRVARDVVRLLQAGESVERVALEAARFDASHGEYGPSHALPLALDVLGYMPRYPGMEAALPLMQAMEMAGDANVRRPVRAVPSPIDPGPDPTLAGERLRELVEAEQAVAAEALLRGALQTGWTRQDIEPWLFRLCSDHFLNFGHALIYQIKLFDLLERVGWEHASALVPTHLFGIVNGTREDLLPGFARFNRQLEALQPEWPALWIMQRVGSLGPWDRQDLMDAIREGSLDTMMEALTSALRVGVPSLELINALSLCAAERLLQFDVAIDSSPGVQEGWLDVTHILTFANAVRHALTRDAHPESLKQLFFAARFVHNARPLVLPLERRHALNPSTARRVTLSAIRSSVLQGKTPRALALTRAWLQDHSDAGPLFDMLMDLAMGDRLTRPIVVAHAIKTTVAAREEYECLRGDVLAHLLPLSVIKLLSSSIQERAIARLTGEAIAFVREGKIPRTLTS